MIRAFPVDRLQHVPLHRHATFRQLPLEKQEPGRRNGQGQRHKDAEQVPFEAANRGVRQVRIRGRAPANPPYMGVCCHQQAHGQQHETDRGQQGHRHRPLAAVQSQDSQGKQHRHDQADHQDRRGQHGRRLPHETQSGQWR